MEGRFLEARAEEELFVRCCHTVAAEGFFFAPDGAEDCALGPGSSPPPPPLDARTGFSAMLCLRPARPCSTRAAKCGAGSGTTSVTAPLAMLAPPALFV